MGGLRDWGQQAAVTPNIANAPQIYYPFVAINSNIRYKNEGEGGADPTIPTDKYDDYKDFYGLDPDGTFNIATELFAIRTENGENPYQHLRAYDPKPHLDRVDQALRKLSLEIDRRASNQGVRGSAKLGVEIANIVLGEDVIDAAVASERARMRDDYLESKSNLLTELWLTGGIRTSQLGGDLALLEDGFNRNVNSYATKLALMREDKRAEIAMRIMDVDINQGDRAVSLRQVYIAVAIDVLRASMTAGQDKIDKDLEYSSGAKFWNLNLLQMALSANSAAFGAQMKQVQTKGERLTSTLASSASMAVQAGLATGNPGAGLALGGLNFLAQTLFK